MTNMKPSAPTVAQDDENDLFYFESDHLALKENKDYSELLKTIFTLDSQRERALKDYDEVVNLHKKALDNPLTFLQKIKNHDSIGVPELQHLMEVPKINWSKYNVEIPEEGLKLVNDTTENFKKIVENEQIPSKMSSETHKQPWTTEEQKRLEELLIVYPPEPIELRRFKKIAAALGNRTTKQVCSRVQKYFLKLYKAGLPIPGRIPKCAEKSKRSHLHKHQRHNHYLWKPTTFFPELDIPVVMNETEQVPGPSQSSNSAEEKLADKNSFNYLIPSGYHNENEDTNDRSVTEIQLDILQRVKYEKQLENELTEYAFQHIGYTCDYCSEEPITGTRWHCQTCLADSVDFCNDCVVSQMYSEKSHPLSHKFIIFRNDNFTTSSTYSDSAESSVDTLDYSSNEKSEASQQSSSEDDSNQALESVEEEFEVSNTNPDVKTKAEGNSHTIANNEDTSDTNSVYNEQSLVKEEIDFEQFYNDQIINFIQKSSYEGLNNFEKPHNGSSDKSEDLARVCKNEHYMQTEQNVSNINATSIDDGLSLQQYTDTQTVSYDYLHSNLLLDDNT